MRSSQVLQAPAGVLQLYSQSVGVTRREFSLPQVHRLMYEPGAQGSPAVQNACIGTKGRRTRRHGITWVPGIIYLVQITEHQVSTPGELYRLSS